MTRLAVAGELKRDLYGHKGFGVFTGQQLRRVGLLDSLGERWGTDLVEHGEKRILRVIEKEGLHFRELLRKHGAEEKEYFRVVRVRVELEYNKKGIGGPIVTRELYGTAVNLETESVVLKGTAKLAGTKGFGRRDDQIKVMTKVSEIGGEHQTNQVTLSDVPAGLEVRVVKSTVESGIIKGHEIGEKELEAFELDFRFSATAATLGFDEKVALATMKDFEGMPHVQDAARKVIEAVEKDKRLFLYVEGGYGVGKTHLLFALAKELCRRRDESSGIMINTPQLDRTEEVYTAVGDVRESAIREFRGLAETQFAGAKDSGKQRVWFFDDLQERGPSTEVLLAVAEAVYNYGGLIVATSNRPLKEIISEACQGVVREVGRIESRISGFAETLKLDGPDRRRGTA